jgi:hypothetical protein
MCQHRFGVQLLQNPPLCSSTLRLYVRDYDNQIENFTDACSVLTQGKSSLGKEEPYSFHFYQK